MGDICDHRDIKIAGNHAPLRQPMRGAFQHAMCHARGDHFRQVTLDGGSIRRGDVKARIQRLGANNCADRGNHAGWDASLGQDMMNHAGGGGLAIRASNTNHSQFARGVIVQARGQVGQRATRVPFNLQEGERRGLRPGPVADGQHSTVGGRLGQVIHAVAAFTLDDHEGVAGQNLAGVTGDARNPHGGHRRQGHEGQFFEQR